jgi:hypothetical protein
LAARLSDAGKGYVKSWSAPVMARRMVDLYQKVVADYKAQPLNNTQRAES